jgi:hypothetical protein
LNSGDYTSHLKTSSILVSSVIQHVQKDLKHNVLETGSIFILKKTERKATWLGKTVKNCVLEKHSSENADLDAVVLSS